MRSLTTRTLLPLAVLAAGPLLGWGGSARAGYVAPASLAVSPSSGLAADVGAASAAAPADSHDNDAAHLRLPSALPDSCSPATGASGQPAPDGPGAAGSGPQLTLAARPQTDPPAVSGVLFLGEALRRPPPFPSRLFRPPRRAWA